MSDSTITSIAPAPNTVAGYAGQSPDEDFLREVLCWAVIEYEDGSPSEVMGEVFDDGAIQEATTLEDEYEVTLVGYFKNDGKGIELFKKACEDFRSED